MFVSFSHCFLSSFSLPFSRFLVCVSFSVSSSHSLSLPPSAVSLSSFLPFFPLLGSLFIFGFFSFPLLLFFTSPIPLSLFVPVVGYSSFSSRPSFSPYFSVFCSLSAPLVFPLLPHLSSPQFLSSSFVSVSFPLPSSSLHADSSPFWSVLAPLRCVSLSPFLSWLFYLSFSLSGFASFSESSSSRPFYWPPPPLLPSFVYLVSSFSASLPLSSFSASLPLPSSPSLPSPVFFLVLLRFLSPSVSSSAVSSLSVRRPFVLLLAFLLFLLLLVFDPLPLPVSPPLSSSSFLSDSASRWFSSAHPLVCLSCSAGWSASVLSSSSSSPFSSSPVVFVSSLVFVGGLSRLFRRWRSGAFCRGGSVP